MKHKLATRDQLLDSKEGREHLAIALILYSDFRGEVGVDWMERAKEMHAVASILGVSEEVAEWQSRIPKGKWDLNRGD